FHLSSQSSLGGPAAFSARYSQESMSPTVFLPLPSPQVLPGPLLIPPDSSTELTQTVLEGESISCFQVGGEKRLCLPQVLNSVLREFTLQQINTVCDELYIYCSRCTSDQLHILKVLGILPFTAPSCGLITLTDAQRLCNALLRPRTFPQNGSILPAKNSLAQLKETGSAFEVEHECLGKCQGLFAPQFYVQPDAPCIQCLECCGMFAPQTFVMHSHRSPDKRTCHWGFESAKWHCYLHVNQKYLGTPEEKKLKIILEEMKEKFSMRNGKRSQSKKLTSREINIYSSKHSELQFFLKVCKRVNQYNWLQILSCPSLISGLVVETRKPPSLLATTPLMSLSFSTSESCPLSLLKENFYLYVEKTQNYTLDQVSGRFLSFGVVSEHSFFPVFLQTDTPPGMEVQSWCPVIKQEGDHVPQTHSFLHPRRLSLFNQPTNNKKCLSQKKDPAWEGRWDLKRSPKQRQVSPCPDRQRSLMVAPVASGPPHPSMPGCGGFESPARACQTTMMAATKTFPPFPTHQSQIILQVKKSLSRLLASSSETQDDKGKIMEEVMRTYVKQQEKLNSILQKKQQLQMEVEMLGSSRAMKELTEEQQNLQRELESLQNEHAQRMEEFYVEQKDLEKKLEQVMKQKCSCDSNLEKDKEAEYAAQLAELRQRLDHAEADRQELQDELRQEREARQKLEMMIKELKLQILK
uniref:SKI like proto-onco n=1 Tax=Otolemur garnettii TaxID=30611 RepID=H0XYN1_OTOGA